MPVGRLVEFVDDGDDTSERTSLSSSPAMRKTKSLARDSTMTIEECKQEDAAALIGSVEGRKSARNSKSPKKLTEMKIQGVVHSLEDVIGVDKLTGLLQAIAGAVQALQYEAVDQERTLQKAVAMLDKKIDNKVEVSQNMLYGAISKCETQGRENARKVEDLMSGGKLLALSVASGNPAGDDGSPDATPTSGHRRPRAPIHTTMAPEVVEKQLKALDKSNKETTARLQRMERGASELQVFRDHAQNEIEKCHNDVAELQNQLRTEIEAHKATEEKLNLRTQETDKKVAEQSSQISELHLSLNHASRELETQNKSLDRIQTYLEDQKTEYKKWSESVQQHIDKFQKHFDVLGGIDKLKSDIESLREMRKQVLRIETAAIAACSEAERALAVVEAVDQNHQNGMSALRSSVEGLANTIGEAFALEGARATNKCLLCAEKRPQMERPTMHGQDNKSYLASQSAIQSILQKMRRKMEENEKETEKAGLHFTGIDLDGAKRGAPAWRRPLSARAGSHR